MDVITFYTIYWVVNAVHAFSTPLPEHIQYFRSMSDLQEQVCFQHYTCAGGFIEVRRDEAGEAIIGNTTKKCCGTCTCDAMCEAHGSCCLEHYGSFELARYYTQKTVYRCERAQLLHGGLIKYHHPNRIWLVSRCDEETTDEILKESCEDPDLTAPLQDLITVTDLRTHVHYRNRFCALCNGLDETVPLTTWDIRIACDRILFASDPNFVLNIKQRYCNLLFEFPKETATQTCVMPPYTISKCNETKLWPIYDEAIDLACDAFLDPFNLTYKNYFCYVCNTAEPIEYDEEKCKGVKFHDFNDVTPSFSLIINLDNIIPAKSEDTLNCDKGTQFEDHKLLLCRDLLCHESRVLVEGACAPKIGYKSDAPCFELFFLMTPMSELNYSSITNSLLDGIRFTLFHEARDFNVIELHLYVKTLDDNMPDYIVAHMAVAETSETSVHNISELQIRLHDILVTVFYNFEEDTLSFWMKTQSYTTTVSDNILVLKVPNGADMYLELTPVYNYHKSISSYSECTAVKKLFSCTFVEIGLDELDFAIENDVLFFEKANDNNLNFSKWQYDIHENKVHMCLEDFRHLYESVGYSNHRRTFRADDTVSSEELVSFICICFSLVSLLVTMATYIIYSELQSQPGINNVILCASLFLAQSVYQFGTGQRSLSHWACTIVGAISHFLWLCVAFAMNVCSVHMFTIFKKNIQISSNVDWILTVKYILYIVCGSLFFVCVSLVGSLLSTNGEDSGYGGMICYLSSYVMHLVTFICPLAVIITSNVFLFGYVVLKLAKINKFTNSKFNMERNYFGVYIRLSTLTGLTWLIGFLQLFLESDILKYCFIVLNASQGVFIMAAFIINKRVYYLCLKDKCNCYSEKIHTSIKTSKTDDQMKDD